MQTYLVGGAVRDEIMGQKSKDLDYTVVFDDGDLVGVEDPFTFMAEWFENLGYKIFVRSPEFYTIRAQTPDRKETADFVLARKEGPYSDGRRPDYVMVGTLIDDLSRRDFRFNAIAKVPDVGSGKAYIDPFNGMDDIRNRRINTVGNAVERFTEDALRAIRALRFSVTKGFEIAESVQFAMQVESVLDDIAGTRISDERIREELNKMFSFDTVASIMALNRFPALTRAMFTGSVSLEATMKQR
jgi:tRNA nucleotidyltransferase/poly(A) polymerase